MTEKKKTKAQAPDDQPVTEPRHAVYDTTHLRFVGGPAADKKSADAEVKRLTEETGHTYEVREV